MKLSKINNILICTLLAAGAAACGHHDEPEEAEPVEVEAPAAPVAMKVSRRVGNLSRQFNDKNPAHLEVAERVGIKPIESLRDVLRIERPLEEVATCEDFTVDELTHSFPYLVPEAAALLHDVGARFRDSIAARSGGDYRVIVTSVLRTNESVKRLRRRNVNSTENSAHLYGTTFDVSYVRFHQADSTSVECREGDMKNLLAEVLMELRDEGRCLVKFERKQGCFHITACR